MCVCVCVCVRVCVCVCAFVYVCVGVNMSIENCCKNYVDKYIDFGTDPEMFDDEFQDVLSRLAQHAVLSYAIEGSLSYPHHIDVCL